MQENTECRKTLNCYVNCKHYSVHKTNWPLEYKVNKTGEITNTELNIGAVSKAITQYLCCESVKSLFLSTNLFYFISIFSMVSKIGSGCHNNLRGFEIKLVYILETDLNSVFIHFV